MITRSAACFEPGTKSADPDRRVIQTLSWGRGLPLPLPPLPVAHHPDPAKSNTKTSTNDQNRLLSLAQRVPSKIWPRRVGLENLGRRSVWRFGSHRLRLTLVQKWNHVGKHLILNQKSFIISWKSSKHAPRTTKIEVPALLHLHAPQNFNARASQAYNWDIVY